MNEHHIRKQVSQAMSFFGSTAVALTAATYGAAMLLL